MARGKLSKKQLAAIHAKGDRSSRNVAYVPKTLTSTANLIGQQGRTRKDLEWKITEHDNLEIVKVEKPRWYEGEWEPLYQIMKKPNVKFIKTQSYTPAGKYKETSIDQRKKDADFRLMQVSPYVIKWKDGRVETVNKRKLDKLQKAHPNYMSDF